MIRLASFAKSSDGSRPQPTNASTVSTSTLSPLAPPFTFDRSLPAVTYPNNLSRPPATGSLSRYFVSTGDSVWPSSSSGSSILSNSNSGLGTMKATQYYPYYLPVHDSVDGSLEKMPDYEGYVGGWSGTFCLEDGMPARGSVANSSWMNSLTSSQMSLALKRKGTIESFNANDDSFGSWHGAHNASSSILGPVGLDSEWLDDGSGKIYTEESKPAIEGSRGEKLGINMMPNEGSSFFHSPETFSITKECDTFIPSSYDSYISQLSFSSRNSMQTSLKQGYPLSNEKNETLSSPTALKPGNSAMNHVILKKRVDGNGKYVIGIHNEAAICENAESIESLEKLGFSCDSMENINTSGPSLPKKDLLPGHCSALKQSIDCLQGTKFGSNAGNLNSCIASNSEGDGSILNASIQISPEIHDRMNASVDSPCWKGSSMSRRYPFCADENLHSLIDSVPICTNDLVQDQRPLKNQSDIAQDEDELSPDTDFDIKLKDCAKRGSNPTKVVVTKETQQTHIQNQRASKNQSDIAQDEDKLPPDSDFDIKLLGFAERESNPTKVVVTKETQQPHIQGRRPLKKVSELESDLDFFFSILARGISKPTKVAVRKETQQPHIHGEKVGLFVKQAAQTEDFICEAGSNIGKTVATVRNSDFDDNHISTSLNHSSSFNRNASIGEMNLSSLNTVPPAELKKPISSDVLSKRRSHGQVSQVLVKAMLSLSEFLLWHYFNDDKATEEFDLEPVQQIIGNLEAVILRSKRGMARSCSPAAGAEAIWSEINESNGERDRLVKSPSPNFDESEGMTRAFSRILRSGFVEQDEDPKILLYKNLWVQAEATLCSLKHDVALMKLEMGNLKHHLKAKSQVSSDGLEEPINMMGAPDASNISKDHRGLNRCTSIYSGNSSVFNTKIGKNHEQNVLKEDEMDSSVFARLRVLKGREGAALSGSDAPQECNSIKSNVDWEEIGEMNELAPDILDVNFIAKRVLQPQNASKFTATKNIAVKKLPDFDGKMGQESLFAASNGSVNQCYNPRSPEKWPFLSGIDSPSSEWEHVLKDEFIW